MLSPAEEADLVDLFSGAGREHNAFHLIPGLADQVAECRIFSKVS